MVRFVFVAGALAGFALAALSCGNSGCSPSNCQGCCTGNTCFPGDTDAVCGGSGVACTACQMGVESCQMHICVNGAGGGNVPLDDAGCEAVPVVNLMPAVIFTDDAGMGYQLVDVFVGSPTSTATSTDFGTVELYYPSGMFPQGMRTVPLGATFQACTDCVYYDEGCDPNGVNPCAHDYLARSGTLQIDSFVSAPGSISGSASNLHFVEWNFQSDTAVAGGKCVDVGSMSYQGSW